jgi:hypothetical protein
LYTHPEYSGCNFGGPRKRVFREIFAGIRNMTRAFRSTGNWDIGEALEAFPRGKYDWKHDMLINLVFQRLCEEARAARNQHWHFALPCSSFSIMNSNMNKGTRSKALPMGNGSKANEIVGNKLLTRSLALIRLLAQGGNTWSLENPGTSWVFHMPAIQKLLRRQSVYSVFLDQCMFGLKVPGCKAGEYVRKYTRIIGNLPLHTLNLRCDNSHTHVHAIGTTKYRGKMEKRSSLAGRYPLRLCAAVEAAALSRH